VLGIHGIFRGQYLEKYLTYGAAVGLIRKIIEEYSRVEAALAYLAPAVKALYTFECSIITIAWRIIEHWLEPVFVPCTSPLKVYLYTKFKFPIFITLRKITI